MFVFSSWLQTLAGPKDINVLIQKTFYKRPL